MIDYSVLNKEQLQAVHTTEGYVRVIASAGSGKTRALTYRYVYLVDELGVSTANIACITFTNKAAGEMKKRIRAMIGDRDIGYICTFHGLGVKILHEDIHNIKWPYRFRILDEEDREAILKRVYQTLGITKEVMTFKDAKEAIRKYKVSCEEQYVPLLSQNSIKSIKSETSNQKNIIERVIYEYLAEQKKEFSLDFDDLIMIPLYIFKQYDEIRIKWAKRFQYVMVDEFQDVSHTNYALCKAMSSVHENLFVVGDPDQLIYSWRGARIEYIKNFDKVHPNTKTIMMNMNYRCNEGIIQAANSLISRNVDRIHKEMITIKKSNILANYYHAMTVFEEASFVAQTIQTLVSLGVRYSDIALLYRAHYVTRDFEQVFMNNKIPYMITSGTPFYQRKEIKDIISYMRFVQNDNDLDFERIIKVPKRGIGDKRIEVLKDYAEQHGCSLYEALKKCVHMSLFNNTKAQDFISSIEDAKSYVNLMTLSDFVDKLYTASGLEDELRQLGDDDRLENVAALKAAIQDMEDDSSEDITLEDYLNTIALYTSADETTNKDAVKMMTIHAAKGLEFPYVFVICMNEGIMPSSKVKTINALEEERRLAYVAFTRAEEELYITESEGYNLDGSFRYPSRFIFNASLKNLKMLSELKRELFDGAFNYIENHERSIAQRGEKEDGKRTADDFRVGDKVSHKQYGKGIIIEQSDREVVTVEFENLSSPRTISITKLERPVDN